MAIEIREITLGDYSDVVLLWNDVLGNHSVNNENFQICMEKMNNDGNYKTFVYLWFYGFDCFDYHI